MGLGPAQFHDALSVDVLGMVSCLPVPSSSSFWVVWEVIFSPFQSCFIVEVRLRSIFLERNFADSSSRDAQLGGHCVGLLKDLSGESRGRGFMFCCVERGCIL